jgi:hypothetical protein
VRSCTCTTISKPATLDNVNKSVPHETSDFSPTIMLDNFHDTGRRMSDGFILHRGGIEIAVSLRETLQRPQERQDWTHRHVPSN